MESTASSGGGAEGRWCGRLGALPAPPPDPSLPPRTAISYTPTGSPDAELGQLLRSEAAAAMGGNTRVTRMLGGTQPEAGGQWNIGHACTLVQCEAGRADKVAFRWLAPDLTRTDYTFADLEAQSSRFANVLQGLGIGAGDPVFTFLPRMPEQFFAFLGTLKVRAVVGPLFSSFGEEALRDRLGNAQARCLVTKRSLFRRVRAVLSELPTLSRILLCDADDDQDDTVLSLPRLMAEASESYEAPLTPPDTPSVLHYTSGSTGKPRGVLHVHGSLVSQRQTARDVLGLRDDDVYWCTADQGWVTGTSYGIIGPWSLGVTQVHFSGGFDPEAWFTLLQRERVSVWYSAPTALRMLMQQEATFFGQFDLFALRHICSVGEPLNPEVIRWCREVLGREVYDTWFQTETGSIMIANRPGLKVRPGSMGLPVEGAEGAVLGDDGSPQPDGRVGHLCLKAGWPSMFRGYLGDEGAYASRFRDGYYYSGDMAYRDGDGYFWFQGRSDDVINTAGHLVSPFEVESALLELPQIAASGVIGAPDDLLFEKVVAFVSLREGCEWTPEVELKVRLHVSNKVSSIATPQEIRVVDAIPRNQSGKILRRVLKARYLGQDAGDLSTMEE